MKLYEINAALAALLQNVDEDTGELMIDAEAIDALMLERGEVLENMALEIKNLTAEGAAIAAEETALKERRKRLERKAEWLKGYLAENLNGEKMETPRVSVTFRRSKAVELDEERFWSWCADHPEYARRKDPEPDKKAITDALKRGEEIPGAFLVERVSMTIK